MSTSSKTDAKISVPRVPPILRQLSRELQPVEFADVIYGEATDVFGGAQQYLLLIGIVLFLDGVMLLFAGILVLTFETHEYFMTAGWICTAVGTVMLIVYIGLEWWHTHRSMK